MVIESKGVYCVSGPTTRTTSSGTPNALAVICARAVCVPCPISVVLVYSVIVTAVVLWAVQMLVGLRVDEDSELDGLDLSIHGEQIGT